jgi:hypothetical protein
VEGWIVADVHGNDALQSVAAAHTFNHLKVARKGGECVGMRGGCLCTRRPSVRGGHKHVQPPRGGGSKDECVGYGVVAAG